MLQTIKMRHILSLTSYLAFALLAPSRASATDAAEVTGNPIGAQYIANFPGGGDQKITAQVVVASADAGASLTININGPSVDGTGFCKFRLAERLTML